MTKTEITAIIDSVNKQYKRDGYNRRITRRSVKTAIRRINRGMALLDDIQPDWMKSVHITQLVMSNGNACICGHIFGHYESASTFFGLRRGMFSTRGDRFGRRHGFMSSDLVPFELLDVLWIEAIRARRKAKKRVMLREPVLS